MSHPDAGELLALHDEELEGSRAVEVTGHLERCEACRRELEALVVAARRFRDALPVVDEAAPVPSLPHRSGGQRRRVWVPLARAAVLLLVLAGAASAVIPGSPVREWVAALVRPAEREPSLPAVGPVAVPDPGPPVAELPASISAPTREGEIHISVTGFDPESSVRVRLVEEPEARVEVSAGAQPRFRVGSGRIEVEGSGPAHLRVDLPRATTEATVEIDGRLAVLKRGGELQLLRPALDSLQGDVRFRVGP